MRKTGKLQGSIATLMLVVTAETANAASLITDIKYEIKSHYYNFTKTPYPIRDPEGNIFGTITHVEYSIESSRVIYNIKLAWAYHEGLKAGAQERGETKEQVNEEIRNSTLRDLVQPYCDVSGKVYHYRADGVTLQYSIDLLSFGSVIIVVGESTCL